MYKGCIGFASKESVIRGYEALFLDIRRLQYIPVPLKELEELAKLSANDPLVALVIDIRTAKRHTPSEIAVIRRQFPKLPVLVFTNEELAGLEEYYLAGVNGHIPESRNPLFFEKTMKRFLEPVTQGLRVYPRINEGLDIHWKRTEETEMRSAKILNLSLGGTFILDQTAIPKPNEIVMFGLEFKKQNRSVNGRGIVRWNRLQPVEQYPAGFGIEFVKLDNDDRQFILEVCGTNSY